MLYASTQLVICFMTGVSNEFDMKLRNKEDTLINHITVISKHLRNSTYKEGKKAMISSCFSDVATSLNFVEYLAA